MKILEEKSANCNRDGSSSSFLCVFFSNKEIIIIQRRKYESDQRNYDKLVEIL